MSKAIVTHSGRAHFDEFTAISLLLAATDAVEVWRKEPNDDDRFRTDIILVDVGGEFEPQSMNFDHHQDEDLPSSLTLVARHLGIEEAATEAFQWWEYKDVLDTSGPRAAAEAVGVEGDTRPLMSPIEGYMLDWFAEQEYVKPKLLEIMEEYGQSLLDRVEEFEEKLQEAREEGELVEVEGIPTYLLPGKNADSGVLRALRGELGFDATITSDPRSGGFSAYRYDDLDYEIDMSGVEGEDVHFAHKSGFLATTASVEAAKEALAEGLR